MYGGAQASFFITTASAVLAAEHVCTRIVPVTDIGAVSDFPTVVQSTSIFL